MLALTPLVSSSSTRARHLLRALLREASYLPDAAARTFVCRRIIARYRDHPAYRDHVSTHFDGLIRSGEKQLRQLARANNGEHLALTRVLLHTYGRVGKRRYELMKPVFVEPAECHTDGSQLSASQASSEVYGHPLPLPRALVGPFKTRKDTLQFRISPRFPLLRSLVYSQAKQSEQLYAERHIKSVTFEMPFKNLWQRVQPRKRQTNAATQWYATVLDKIQPPLPADEWLQLKRLATGEDPWKNPPRRRKSAGQSLRSQYGVASTACLIQLQHQHNVDSISHLSTSVLLEDELRIKSVTKQLRLHNGKDGGHRITSRFMRHLYMNILVQCPLVDYNNDKSNWTITWFNRPRQKRGTSSVPLARSADSSRLMNENDAQCPERSGLSLLFGTATEAPSMLGKRRSRSAKQVSV